MKKKKYRNKQDILWLITIRDSTTNNKKREESKREKSILKRCR